MPLIRRMVINIIHMADSTVVYLDTCIYLFPKEKGEENKTDISLLKLARTICPIECSTT